MSADRKRYDSDDLAKGSRKKPRLESPDQEISVHPFDDDFSGLEDDSPTHMITGKLAKPHMHNIIKLCMYLV